MAAQLRTELVLDALDMALRSRRPQQVIHHSDHGCQYTPIAFGLRCREAGVQPSMGSVGDAYDNALCESFFATLECELLDRQRFATQAAARLAVFDYIKGWSRYAGDPITRMISGLCVVISDHPHKYNPRRRHSALDYLSPRAYEKRELVGV